MQNVINVTQGISNILINVYKNAQMAIVPIILTVFVMGRLILLFIINV